MASFKLCISDPSSGKTFQKEVKDAMASPFIGLNIGESVKGDNFELNGYELQITGGSDYCGFPMRSGILGARKKISMYGGVGFKGDAKGIKRRKTVCGHKIHDKISQINLKVLKAGSKKLAEIFGVPEKSEAKEEKKAEVKEEKKESKETKQEIKEHKIEEKTEHKEHKTEEKKEAKEHKPAEKHHEKPAAKEHKEEKKE
jgi:small subunit ribosomal protein S6e